MFAAIIKVTEDVDDPAEFVVVTEKAVESKVSVGVPLMAHVKLSIESPVGSGGLVEQFVIAAPRLFKVVGDTDIATSTTPLVPVAPA